MFISHQPPFSFLPPSSSFLCAEEHKQSNTSTAAHTSSVLQLSAPCLHTEGFERAAGAHTEHTLTLPSFFHSCQQNSAAAHFLPLFVFFSLRLFLSLSLLLLLLLSSCQVDISFISQEVFDRPFYEEMYPPAAPPPQHNYSKSPPGQTLSFVFFSLLHSGPSHLTQHLFSFFFFNTNILQCLEQHLEERPSLYFVFVVICGRFLSPQRSGSSF